MTLDHAVRLARTRPEAIWISLNDAEELVAEANKLLRPSSPPLSRAEVEAEFRKDVRVCGVPVRLLEIAR